MAEFLPSTNKLPRLNTRNLGIISALRRETDIPNYNDTETLKNQWILVLAQQELQEPVDE